jgi:phosphatidylinositol alpha-1,6-mannosyltransferase
VGGSGRWLWELYRRLRREDILIFAGEVAGGAEFDCAHDVRVRRLPLSLANWGMLKPAAARAYLGLAGEVIRTIREESVKAVHCGRCLPEGMIAALARWRTGVPFVCYAHGEELTYGRQSRELAVLMRFVFARARAVIGNSRNTLRMLAEEWRVPAPKLVLMHPGVDSSRFHPAVRDASVRRRLGWGDRPVVLTVGRLQERKGHDAVLRSLPEIRSKVPNVLYAIVGDGERRGPLLELAAREDVLNHVVFHGELDDEETLECYQQCDLFVLPNRRVGHDIEGFGMVLVEAQSCGKPVVAGSSGGTAETMQAPETGLLLDCENPRAIAATFIDLLRDPERCARMGHAARAWAVDQFDWSALSHRAGELFAALR